MYCPQNATAFNLPIRNWAQTGHPTNSRVAEQFICNTPPDANVKMKSEQHHSWGKCDFKSTETCRVQRTFFTQLPLLLAAGKHYKEYW